MLFRPNIEKLQRNGDTDALHEALQNKNGDVRRQALVALGEQRDVDGIVEALQHNDAAFIRETAAYWLGDVGDERAVQPLLDALKEEDACVRANAVEALGKLGEGRGIDSLIGILEADEFGVARSHAAEALGRLADPRAVEPLISALEDEDARYRAIEALGRLGDPRAVEALGAVLGDEDGAMRLSAVMALGRLADPHAVEPLIGALEDKQVDVRCRAVEALRKLGNPRAVEALDSIRRVEDDAARPAAVEALRALMIAGIDLGHEPSAGDLFKYQFSRDDPENDNPRFKNYLSDAWEGTIVEVQRTDDATLEARVRVDTADEYFGQKLGSIETVAWQDVSAGQLDYDGYYHYEKKLDKTTPQYE